MLRVGLTGNVASGKSTVADAWRRAGALVIDADVLSREAVAPGSPALAAIRQHFGEEVFDASGALDRAALRRTVFASAGARTALEGIVHPEVARLRSEAEARARDEGARLIVHEIPLLYEKQLDREMDVVVLVHAPERVRLERLITRRGLTEAEARAVMNAQLPADAKRARADIVIENDSTEAALTRRALEVLAQLRQRAGAD